LAWAVDSEQFRKQTRASAPRWVGGPYLRGFVGVRFVNAAEQCRGGFTSRGVLANDGVGEERSQDQVLQSWINGQTQSREHASAASLVVPDFENAQRFDVSVETPNPTEPATTLGFRITEALHCSA